MRFVVWMFLVGTLSGCSSLDGSYDGRLTCADEEAFQLNAELHFESDGERDYLGTGRFWNAGAFANGAYPLECQTVTGDSVPCELVFDLDVRVDGKAGEQELDISFTNCRYQADDDLGESGDFDTPETDCRDQVEEITWDGKDNIEWKRWWNPDVVCTGDLER